MSAKKTSDQPSTGAPTAESIAEQMAAVKAQQAALKAQQKELREKARALRPAKAERTLAQVIQDQNSTYQKYIVRSIAGRVLERCNHGQDPDTAMTEVLATMKAWTEEEM